MTQPGNSYSWTQPLCSAAVEAGNPKRREELGDGDAKDALARHIAEEATQMPAYLVDDEIWAAALARAEDAYVPPKPETPLQRACRRARGDLVGAEVVEAIQAYNRGVLRVRP